MVVHSPFQRSILAALALVLAFSSQSTAKAQGFGSALQFSTGSSPDFVEFADRPAFNFGTGNFTLEFWFSKPNPRLETLVSKRVGCNNTPYWQLVGDTVLTFSIRTNSTTFGFSTGTTVISGGAWHHIAAVREGVTTRLYVDGVAEGSSDATSVVSVSNAASVVFGTGPCDPATLNPSLHFSGAADEVMVWGTARTEAEIRGDRNGMRTGAEPGLLLYWPLNEGGGQVATDASPNGVNGQLGTSTNPDTADPTWITSGAVAQDPSVPSLRPLALDVYPNPVRSVATLAFSLSEPGPYQVLLVDLLGREVLRRNLDGAGGEQAVHISARGLTPGVYLARLRTPDGEATRLVTLAR